MALNTQAGKDEPKVGDQRSQWLKVIRKIYRGSGFQGLTGYGDGHVTYAVYGQYAHKTHVNSSSALE